MQNKSWQKADWKSKKVKRKLAKKVGKKVDRKSKKVKKCWQKTVEKCKKDETSIFFGAWWLIAYHEKVEKGKWDLCFYVLIDGQKIMEN